MAERGTGQGPWYGVCRIQGDNGYGAMVAEVEVDQTSGTLHVTRFVVALDCGPIANPDGLRAQIEGGALQGLSRALGEEVTWDAQQVTSIDWQDRDRPRVQCRDTAVSGLLSPPRSL